jgi:hypothetical protein
MVKKGVHFRLEESLFSALKAEAQKQGTEMTSLVTRFLKQGLGLSDVTSQDIPTFDVSELEEKIAARLSQQWSERIDNIEQCISEEIENRVSSHVANSVKNLEQRLLKLEAQSTLPKTASTDTQLDTQNVEELENKTPHNPEPLSSNANTQLATQLDTQQEVNTQNLTESLTSLGTLPLFNSIDSGEIVKPSKLVEYLNTQVVPETSSKWDIQKLRNLKNRQVTYWKKPANERKGEPVLPIVINQYLIDWIFSEEGTTKDSAGKQWWIQCLPQDASEAEKLITARREGWKVHHDQ